MAGLQDFRQQNPEYNDMSDQALSDALYNKHYSDMPRAAFDAKMSSAPEVSGLQGAIETFQDATTGVESGIPFSDEMVAGAAAPFRAAYGIGRDVIQGRGGKGLLGRLGEAYDTELGNIRGIQQRAAERSPIAHTGGAIAGGMALGGQLSKGGATLLNVAKPTVPGMIGRGAAEGAAYGGVYGFGEGEGVEDRVNRGLEGAAIGALTGGALGAAGGVQAAKEARRAIPETEQLKQMKTAAYQAVKDSGISYTPQQVRNLANAVRSAVSKAKISPVRHPKAASLADDIEDLLGPNPSLTELDQVRQAVRRDVGNDPAEGHFGDLIIDEIDDFISRVGTLGDPIMKQARSLNSQWRKAELIDDAVIRATRRAASTGSGGNVDNAIRQNIRSILDNPKKIRGFTKQEKEALERVVKTGKVHDLARLIGKLSPQGSGLMAALGIGGTMANPYMAALPAAGYIAKRAADAATPRNVGRALDIVRSGGSLPQRQALTGGQRALMGGSLFGVAPQVSDLVPR